MHFLGGNKEAMAPFLQQLAAAGVTAVSFDAGNTANGLSSRWLT
jgi:hypothetical protein